MSVVRQIIGTVVLVIVVWGQAINGRLIAHLGTRDFAVALPQNR